MTEETSKPGAAVGPEPDDDHVRQGVMEDGIAPPSQARPKEDPGTLVLRGRPMRPIRFRRGVIITLATIASAGLVATAWLALSPRVLHRVAQDGDAPRPAALGPNDALARLPQGYGDTPRLGPPLPGDLGRPILRAQERQEASQLADGQRPIQDRAAAARLERLAALKVARESALLAVTADRGTGAPSIEAVPPQVPSGNRDDATPTDHKVAFTMQGDAGGDANPSRLAPPASPYMIAAGSVIAGSLITGLNSDLPGLVTAQVTQNVFDSATGTVLLVPQGARLLGRYDSLVAFGQQRALIIWQRLLLPDGSSLRLDNMPATDPSGGAGLADKVDSHSWSLLKGVAIATILGVGTELTIDGEDDLIAALREGGQRSAGRAGDQIVARNLDIQPTITVRPGAPVRLLVSRDLILAPWRTQEGP